jgi:hypothetical protein
MGSHYDYTCRTMRFANQKEVTKQDAKLLIQILNKVNSEKYCNVTKQLTIFK